jgi:hypothetical protein
MYRQVFYPAEHVCVDVVLVRIWVAPLCHRRPDCPSPEWLIARAREMSRSCGLAIRSVDVYGDGIILVRWHGDVDGHETEPGRIYWEKPTTAEIDAAVSEQDLLAVIDALRKEVGR